MVRRFVREWSTALARVCEICGKRPMSGWNPQSVGMNRKRAARRWLPNLQATMVARDGRMVRVNACSRCRRTAEKI
jgi:ribosomal protein L28